ncbi:MAG: EamA family transporter RarD [Actinomycetota bacterium]|nr:EamA family transporter RarD [Actinomycetota bacterium]MDK1027300.1 EamA family transporter RarD [Actinomycetota bacterium]MDK1039052.1 EamA family transporter RarD [Actinomycetota bacterium]MDK1096561.1 EamA family transporter RarD [Actinomycetota bacterium]MDK1103012.1 EamA family transporter RarD [Actinomycetota bacterium]
MEYRRGIWFGVSAWIFWGLTPMFWNLVESDPASLLLHRIVWSVLILALVITMRREWPTFLHGYSAWRPRVTTLAAAALLATNWGVFVWGVTTGHIVEVSLGYFINPLVSVALGTLILKERLRRTQWVAVGIAAFGVTAMAIISGVLPWISLVLAFSFGTYGLLKKHDATPAPLLSLFGETAIMFFPALAAMLLLARTAEPGFGSSPQLSVFLVAAGLISVIPLLLFGAAAKRIPLSTLGFLQYIAPTLQLLVAVVIFEESMTSVELRGFITVWVALAIFSFDMHKNSEHKTQTAAV